MKSFKRYIDIFFSTRAIGLELVSDVSTSVFGGTMKGFGSVSQIWVSMGKPAILVNDCATNFKDESQALREIEFHILHRYGLITTYLS